MGRILRFLASQRFVTEVDEDTFTANNVTQALSKPGFAAGMRHNFESILPCLVKVPQFLADTKYTNPSDVMHSAFQLGHQTDLPAFIWALSQPKMMEDFHLWMAAVYGDRPTTWLDAYDLAKHCEGSTDEDVIFVDVAGGIGHQCALLKAKLPELKGRVILEDLPMVTPQAIPTAGVENMGIDMWQGQPIKGAKTYYMRMILHDYPDDKATALLKLTAEAMTVDSVLVIDELVIPNKGAHGHATQFDLTMLSSLSSIERTDKQWDTLLDSAGFKILEKKPYAPTGESVMVVVPKA
ncbi:putative Sterigmatocystin 8-O-methyltransferase [Glarea lozoyensis 74030]|nr:putative Sterigmatocystin 8-O-methyltransferase [Glarea lozoyensis 74030]